MNELAKAMAALPEPEYKPWPDWNHWRHQLWHDAQELDPETFFTWRVVRHCFLSGWLPVDVAWEEVRHNLDRYGPIMQPIPDLPIYKGYDRNLVRLIGWVAFWEKWTGRQIEKLDRIFEIGAGFGALCEAIHLLGFQGEYVILDLPEIAALQNWYLAQKGITVSSKWEGPCDLLIAYSSLSEVQPEERMPMIEAANPESILLEYGPKYNQWDNVAWFGELRESWMGQCATTINNDMPVEAWWK